MGNFSSQVHRRSGEENESLLSSRGPKLLACAVIMHELLDIVQENGSSDAWFVRREDYHDPNFGFLVWAERAGLAPTKVQKIASKLLRYREYLEQKCSKEYRDRKLEAIRITILERFSAFKTSSLKGNCGTTDLSTLMADLPLEYQKTPREVKASTASLSQHVEFPPLPEVTELVNEYEVRSSRTGRTIRFTIDRRIFRNEERLFKPSMSRKMRAAFEDIFLQNKKHSTEALQYILKNSHLVDERKVSSTLGSFSQAANKMYVVWWNLQSGKYPPLERKNIYKAITCLRRELVRQLEQY